MRTVLVLLAVSGTVGCRHGRPIREEYNVAPSEEAACHDDIELLEEMRQHMGYPDVVWAHAEATLQECLVRQREIAEKHARGEPATADEVYRAQFDRERAAEEAERLRERSKEQAAAARVAAIRQQAVQEADERAEQYSREQAAFARKSVNAQRAWSAVVCFSQGARAEAKAKIAEELKYASEGGGIVDQAALYQQQMVTRLADKWLAEARRHLATIGRVALSCSSPVVKMLTICHKSVEAPCDEERAAPYLGITKDRLNAIA